MVGGHAKAPFIDEGPTSSPFVYDGTNAPLFFFKPSMRDSEVCLRSMEDMSKEYFRLVRVQKGGPRSILSNGCTAGEYCIWLIRTGHSKRKKKIHE